MGVDLNLLPVNSKGSWFCFETITCERNRDLWAAIEMRGEIPVGEDVWCHHAESVDGDTRYGPVRVTPYDTPLTWLPAGALADIMRDQGGYGWKHKAVAAFLAELPADWPVVLFWH